MVYIYEGRSRESSTQRILAYNKQPKIDTTYSVPGDSGILVVAIPQNADQPTDLEFEYWIDVEFSPGPLTDEELDRLE